MAGFIEAVRKRPCLWDPYNRDYRNLERKDAAWKEIVHMGFTDVRNITDAKAEWKKLRDSHRDSMKRNKDGVNNWKYAALMEFLVPYMKRRTKRRALSPNEMETHSPQSMHKYEDETFDENNDDYVEISVPTANDITNYGIDDSEFEIDPTISREESNKRSKLDDGLFELLRDSQKRREEERQTVRELKNMQTSKHPMDLFLESMGKTIKKMPPWMQIRVKRKIFTAVSEAEDELGYSMPSSAITPDDTGNN